MSFDLHNLLPETYKRDRRISRLRCCTWGKNSCAVDKRLSCKCERKCCDFNERYACAHTKINSITFQIVAIFFFSHYITIRCRENNCTIFPFQLFMMKIVILTQFLLCVESYKTLYFQGRQIPPKIASGMKEIGDNRNCT